MADPVPDARRDGGRSLGPRPAGSGGAPGRCWHPSLRDRIAWRVFCRIAHPAISWKLWTGYDMDARAKQVTHEF